MPTVAERLAALEADNVALRDEIARLKGERHPEPAPIAPVPPTYREPVATVSKVPTRHLVMPSDAELRQLYRIASAAHPALVRLPSRFEDEEAPFHEFVAAFAAIGRLGRTPQLDGKRSLLWWIDYAAHDAEGATGSMLDGHAFVLAALAHGDVPYRAWTASSTVEFGLTFSGAGTPAGDAWRRVLASGCVLRPAESAREPRDFLGRVERFGVAVP